MSGRLTRALGAAGATALLGGCVAAVLERSGAGTEPADPLASLYGNTLASAGAGVPRRLLYINSDRTFRVERDGRVEWTGRYAFEGGELCLEPHGDTQRGCAAFRGELRIGENWGAVLPDGHHVSLTLEAGRGGS